MIRKLILALVFTAPMSGVFANTAEVCLGERGSHYYGEEQSMCEEMNFDVWNKKVGDWRLHYKKDKMENSGEMTVATDTPASKVAPDSSLYISCAHRKLYGSFYVGYIPDAENKGTIGDSLVKTLKNLKEITYKVDNELAKKLTISVEDRTEYMQEDTNWIIKIKSADLPKLITELQNHEKLLVRFKPDDSYFITLQFPIKEGKNALQMIKQACGLK